MCAAPATENPTTNGAGPEVPKVTYFDPFLSISFFRVKLVENMVNVNTP